MTWLRRQLARLLGRKPKTFHYDGPTWYASEQSSPFSVPGAFYYVLRRRHFGKSPNDLVDVPVVVAELMRKVKPFQWTQLYSQFKGIDLLPRDVGDLAAFSPDLAVELLGVATLNSSGYVRQAALARLAEIGHARAMPYVLLRLADWVPQVRQAAEQTLTALLDKGLASELLDYSYLIDWLQKVGRVDLSNARRRILGTLRCQDVREALLGRLDRSESAGRLFCYKVLEEELPSRPDLIERALGDPSSVVRRWIVSHVLKVDEAQAVKWLVVLLADRSVQVQTAVLHLLPENLWPQLRDTVEAMIFADSPAVRESARFHMRQHGKENFAERYRQKLQLPGGVRPGFIAGLGETGGKDDFDLAAGFIDSTRPKVRAVTLAAMANLDRSRAVPFAIRDLQDPFGRVQRVAVNTLCAERNPETSSAVRAVLEHGSPKGQIAALRVLVKAGGWEAALAILVALSMDNTDLHEVAWPCLFSWRNTYFYRGWIRPTPAVLREIERRIASLQESNQVPPKRFASIWHDMASLIGEGKKVWY